jgi:hypothetical protein
MYPCIAYKTFVRNTNIFQQEPVAVVTMIAR